MSLWNLEQPLRVLGSCLWSLFHVDNWYKEVQLIAWRVQIQMLILAGKKALGALFSQGRMLMPGDLG